MSHEEPEKPLTDDPDAWLMVTVRDTGDQAAFAKLLQSYHGLVVKVCWRYFGDQQLAEDAAQETFFKVYSARHTYKPQALFKTWLLRIATNVCISKLRKNRIKTTSMNVGEDERDYEFADKQAADPAFAPERSEIQQHVRAAIDSLPERQRMAIILAKFEGLSYPELEVALGVTRQGLKSLLHRAREALKQKLANYVSEPQEP